jgi:RNase P subunit RPR2
MKIKCPLCDFENEEGNKFCKNCNEPLSKQNYSEDNPYTKKKGNEDQPFELISNEEDEIRNEEDEIRNKIEKEEKIRAEVESEIEKEKNKSSLGTGCLGFLVLVIIVYFIMFNPFTSQEKETQPSSIYLNASVRFTGTQFIIENNDNFDWLNVKMEVNGSILKGGFILETDRMKAGETYTVGALQFAKKDGTRFNPVTYKPQDFDIYCDTTKGEDAFWAGGWE